MPWFRALNLPDVSFGETGWDAAGEIYFTLTLTWEE